MAHSNFVSKLIEKCKINPKIVALPESLDLRSLQAAEIVIKNESIRSVYFYCTREEAYEIAIHHELDWNLIDSKSIWAKDSFPELAQQTLEYITAKFEKKGKKVAPEELAKMSQDPLFQSAMHLSKGLVHTVIAGAVNTTASVIKAGLIGVGLQENLKTISGSFILNKSVNDTDHTMIFGDCGVVIDPTVDQLVDIAFSCAQTWEKVIGNGQIKPKIAFLSFSTKGSALHPMASKVIEATNKFKSIHPHIECDGEFQFDAAFDKNIGQRKAPDSTIPGEANIFIFPNLDAGNIAYKITQRLGLYDAYGPILQGMKYPFSDLSRGASAEDIAGSIWINSLRAD